MDMDRTEERVMHDLDEPDEAGHEEGGGELSEVERLGGRMGERVHGFIRFGRAKEELRREYGTGAFTGWNAAGCILIDKLGIILLDSKSLRCDDE